LQEVTTAARQKREDAPVLPSAAPRAYLPQVEEKAAQAGAAASAADRATPLDANQIVGGLPSAPNPARLNAAAAAGDVAQTVALIDKGTDVNVRDGQGRTALMIAVARGKLDVVRLLLQRGADPNLADNGGRTALREAQDKNLGDIAAMLRNAGAR
jgi:ankyrin repeat protein